MSSSGDDGSVMWEEKEEEEKRSPLDTLGRAWMATLPPCPILAAWLIGLLWLAALEDGILCFTGLVKRVEGTSLLLIHTPCPHSSG